MSIHRKRQLKPAEGPWECRRGLTVPGGQGPPSFPEQAASELALEKEKDFSNEETVVFWRYKNGPLTKKGQIARGGRRWIWRDRTLK